MVKVCWGDVWAVVYYIRISVCNIEWIIYRDVLVGELFFIHVVSAVSASVKGVVYWNRINALNNFSCVVCYFDFVFVVLGFCIGENHFKIFRLCRRLVFKTCSAWCHIITHCYFLELSVYVKADWIYWIEIECWCVGKVRIINIVVYCFFRSGNKLISVCDKR